MAFYVKQGVWKQVKQPYVKTQGVWKQVKQIFVKTQGVWKPVYSAQKDLQWLKLKPKTGIRVLGAVTNGGYFVVFYTARIGYQDWERPCILLYDSIKKIWIEWTLATHSGSTAVFNVNTYYDGTGYSFAFAQSASGYNDSWYVTTGGIYLYSSSTFVKDKKLTYKQYGLDSGFTNLVGSNAQVFLVSGRNGRPYLFAKSDRGKIWFYVAIDGTKRWVAKTINIWPNAIIGSKYFWSTYSNSVFTVQYADVENYGGYKEQYHIPINSLNTMHFQAGATIGNDYLPIYLSNGSTIEGEFGIYTDGKIVLQNINNSYGGTLLGYNSDSEFLLGRNKQIWGNDSNNLYQINVDTCFVYRNRGNIANCVSSTYHQTSAVFSDDNNLVFVWWKSESASCGSYSIQNTNFSHYSTTIRPSNVTAISLYPSNTTDGNLKETPYTLTGTTQNQPSDFDIVASCM